MSRGKVYLMALTWVALSCVGLRAQSGITAQNGRQVTCASDDGKRHLCQVTTQYGVRMVNQRSGSPCIQNQTWGFNRSGIWVDRGCRADFWLGGGYHGGGAYPGGGGGYPAVPGRSPAHPTTANGTSATQIPAAASDWSTSGADRHASRTRPGALTGTRSG